MYPEILDGIDIAGVYVHEPGALLSNFAVALTGWAVVAYSRGATSAFSRHWRTFVVFIALGATGGMWTHGFPTLFSKGEFYVLWALKNSCVPLANTFAGLALLDIRGKTAKNIRTGLWIKAVVVAGALFATYSFLPAIFDLGLTYVWVIAATYPSRNSVPGLRKVFLAFVIAFCSGFLYLFPLDLHPMWFTHKDAVHIFVIISLVLIGKTIREFDGLVARQGL